MPKMTKGKENKEVGLFFKRKKETAEVEISVRYGHRKEEPYEEKHRKEEWKNCYDGVWWPPNTVFMKSNRSTVYHAMPWCRGISLADDGEPELMQEKTAIKKGLRRCSKCDWTEHDAVLSRHSESEWQQFWRSMNRGLKKDERM